MVFTWSFKACFQVLRVKRVPRSRNVLRRFVQWFFAVWVDVHSPIRETSIARICRYVATCFIWSAGHLKHLETIHLLKPSLWVTSDVIRCPNRFKWHLQRCAHGITRPPEFAAFAAFAQPTLRFQTSLKKSRKKSRIRSRSECRSFRSICRKMPGTRLPWSVSVWPVGSMCWTPCQLTVHTMTTSQCWRSWAKWAMDVPWWRWINVQAVKSGAKRHSPNVSRSEFSNSLVCQAIAHQERFLPLISKGLVKLVV